MKNLKNFSRRGLALFLSLVMCLSLLPGTALAATGSGTEGDPYIVWIDEESSGEQVKEALNAQVENSPTGWYYICGTSILGGDNWGLVQGYDLWPKTPALTGAKIFEGGETSATYKLAKTSFSPSHFWWVTFKYDNRVESSITLNEGQTVTLVKNADWSGVDYGAVRTAIFDQVVASTEPELSVDDLTIEHKAGSSWYPLEGDKTSLTALSAGEKTIRISWSGNEAYTGFERQIKVNFVEQKKTATEVVLISGVSVPYGSPEEIEQAILTQVFQGILDENDEAVFFDPSQITVEYRAELSLLDGALDIINKIPGVSVPAAENWAPLSGKEYSIGGKVLGSYPAIGVGEQTIRVSYSGAGAYAASSKEISVTITKALVNITVDSKVIKTEDALGNMVIATREDGANVTADAYVIYAGMTSNADVVLYLDVPASIRDKDLTYKATIAALKAVGLDLNTGVKLSDLSADQLNNLLNNDVVKALLEKLIQSGIGQLPSIPGVDNSQIDAGKILDALTKINGAIGDSSAMELLRAIGDHVIIQVGNPEGHAGVYAVAAVVSDSRFQPQSPVALGYLVIKMEQTSVSVGTATIKVGEAIPADLINSNGAPYIAMYGGIEATSDLDATLYVEFSGFAPVEEGTTEITIGQLRSILINRVGEENKPLEALLEKLNRTMPGDSATVKVGQPSTEHAGTYAVAAIAANAGTLPGVGVGSLTIIDKDMAVIAYVVAAEDSRIGTVRLNGNDVGGPVVYELVPGSAAQALKGATAEVKNTDEHHFVKWTAIGLFQQPFYSAEATIKPGRPTGVLSSIPDWVKSLIPNFDRIPDLSKVAAIYVAHFEEHTWGDSIVTIEPTCTTEGVKTYTCTKDGCGATKTEPVAALGHDWGSWQTVDESNHERVCKNDSSHVETAAHNWDAGFVTTNPTCTTEGVKTYTCTDCHATKTESIEKIPHSYGEWDTTTYPSTCKTQGEKFRTCSDCNATDSELLPLDPTHHQKVFDVPAKAPTCTEAGLTAGQFCAACNVVTAKQELVPALGHYWVSDSSETIHDCEDAVVTHQHCANEGCTATRDLASSPVGHTLAEGVYVAPTCTEDGHVAGTYCTVCGAVIEEQETISALGHNYDAVVTDPTCLVGGYTTYTCTRCDDSYQGELVDALGHDYSSTVTEATCTTNGYTTHTCTRCDDSYEDTPVEALGHDYSDIVTAPTCEDQGYTTHICSRGDSTTVDSYVSALGHSWDGGVVTVAPTETTPGVRTYTCTRDSRHTRTETITTLDHTHSYTAVVTAPTHTEQGYTTYTCACGESYVGDYVAAVGHTYTSTITVYPTAYSTGLRTYTCSCGATYTEVIPATGIVDEPTYPTYPGTGTGTGSGTGTGAGSGTGTGTTGSGTATITEPDVPLGETPDSLVDIGEDDVPLSMMPGRLNTMDHIAYIRGYQDGTVRPMNNITRAEVATIFYRLMTDAYRESSYATTHSFTDAPFTQWYNEAISTAANAGILKGYGDGTVRPDNNITRAEFVTIAASFLDGSGAGEVAFTDIHGHWAESDINRAAEAGWIKGDGDGKFRPNDSITRAEAVTIINRILGRATETAEMMDGMVTWPDSRESDWWYIAIQEATNGHDYESALPFEHWTALW